MKAQPMPVAEARQRKRDLGLTWLEIADRCGVSARTLRRYKRKGTLPASQAELLRSLMWRDLAPRTIEEIANRYGGLQISDGENGK